MKQMSELHSPNCPSTSNLTNELRLTDPSPSPHNSDHRPATSGGVQYRRLRVLYTSNALSRNSTELLARNRLKPIRRRHSHATRRRGIIQPTQPIFESNMPASPPCCQIWIKRLSAPVQWELMEWVDPGQRETTISVNGSAISVDRSVELRFVFKNACE